MADALQSFQGGRADQHADSCETEGNADGLIG